MRRKQLHLCGNLRSGLAALVLAGAVAATAGAAQARDIWVTIDEARLVPLDEQVSDVIIGNPSIADVAVQSGRLLVVTGKSFGITNLIVLDAQGKEILNEDIRVRSHKIQTVRMHKGGTRYSYDCAERCETTLVPGDATEFFDSVKKAVTDKIGVAQTAIEGDAGSQ